MLSVDNEKWTETPSDPFITCTHTTTDMSCSLAVYTDCVNPISTTERGRERGRERIGYISTHVFDVSPSSSWMNIIAVSDEISKLLLLSSPL